MKQLRDTLDSEIAAQEGCSKTIKELEGSKKKGETEQKKVATAAEKAVRVHAEHSEALKSQRTQYEAEMGLSTSNGEGAKNMQVAHGGRCPHYL